MKPYLAWKKPFNLNTRQDLVVFFQGLALVILTLLFFFTPFFSFAETAEEIKNKIDQKSADINKLEAEIRNYQKELDSLGKQKNSLSVSLKQLDITKKKLITDISVTQKKIDQTNLKIRGLSSDIGLKQGAILNNQDSIASGLRKTNELETENLVETLLSRNDFTLIWNDIDNMARVREKIIENTVLLRQVKSKLEDTRTETVKAKNELVRLRSQLADQQKIVIQNTKEKNKLLVQTKNSEAGYQKLIQGELIKKLTFERELREYESRLKFILDPSKLPGPGVLSWPLDEIFVTQEFGAKTGPHRTYANGHSGTDFRARTPLPAYAMADGEVAGVGDTDLACPGASFGKWILIEYGNGLASTYGHLSLIKVAKGKKVRKGEVVAYTGSSGRVTGPHLHVSLYVSSAVKVESLPSITCPGHTLTQPLAPINAYLDPMYYLPPLR